MVSKFTQKELDELKKFDDALEKEINKGKHTVIIPKLRNLEQVVEIYHTNATIGNRELDIIFQPRRGKCLSNQTKGVLKRIVNEQLDIIYNHYEVPTKKAFEVWGIDIKVIEKLVKGGNK